MKILLGALSLLVACSSSSTTPTHVPDGGVDAGHDAAPAAALSLKTSGNLNQGSIFALTVTNDSSKPFDTAIDVDQTPTHLAFKLPAGYLATITDATATELHALVSVDVTATTGPFDLDLFSGPDAASGSGDEYTLAAAFTIAASTPVAFTSSAVTLTAPYASKMFTYTPTAAGRFIGFTAHDTGLNSTIVLLDSTGSFASAHTLAIGTPVSYLTTAASPVYVLVWDQPGAGNLSVATTYFDVAAPSTHAGGEGTDTSHQNDTTSGAVTLTPPTVVKDAAFLVAADGASTTDVDTYSVTVTAGQRIYAFTAAGTTDGAGGTALQFLDSTGTAIADAAGNTNVATTENGGYVADFTDALTAGTYYVQVSYPVLDAFDATMTHYDLTVVTQ